MSTTENNAYDEISEEWENFENEIMNFVIHVKSFFIKSTNLK